MGKYRLFIFGLFLISLFSVPHVWAQTHNLPLNGKIIYLDPGHGYPDGGATYKGIEEADLNLTISKKIGTSLQKLGAKVFLTRYDDYNLAVPYAINRKRSDLSRRANLINDSECDLYLSIHLNADSSSSWKGAEAYYDDVNEENKKIAEIMQNQLQKYLGSKRKYKETDSMYLHKRIERPGVLLELGFLSNPNERYLLQQDSYQQKIVTAVTNGVLEYLK